MRRLRSNLQATWVLRLATHPVLVAQPLVAYDAYACVNNLRKLLLRLNPPGCSAAAAASSGQEPCTPRQQPQGPPCTSLSPAPPAAPPCGAAAPTPCTTPWRCAGSARQPRSAEPGTPEPGPETMAGRAAARPLRSRQQRYSLLDSQRGIHAMHGFAGGLHLSRHSLSMEGPAGSPTAVHRPSNAGQGCRAGGWQLWGRLNRLCFTRMRI